jgi:thiosulfate reductase cytochrome b subunit
MDREVLPWEQPRKKTSSVLGLSQKQIRNVLRFCHLSAGMLLVPYVYSPLGDVAAFELVVRVALVPLTVFTGVSMWQQAKLRKLIARGQ